MERQIFLQHIYRHEHLREMGRRDHPEVHFERMHEREVWGCEQEVFPRNTMHRTAQPMTGFTWDRNASLTCNGHKSSTHSHARCSPLGFALANCDIISCVVRTLPQWFWRVHHLDVP